MILGVNEYWEGDDKNTHTNFNLYKKFVQRIIKETGIDYKRVLRYMQSEDNKRKTVLEGKNSDSPYINHFYIFGHSLDVTDGDIFREIIPGMETVPKRAAIVRANRYMVNHSDYLIAYAWHPASNARELVEYALQTLYGMMRKRENSALKFMK